MWLASEKLKLMMVMMASPHSWCYFSCVFQVYIFFKKIKCLVTTLTPYSTSWCGSFQSNAATNSGAVSNSFRRYSFASSMPKTCQKTVCCTVSKPILNGLCMLMSLASLPTACISTSNVTAVYITAQWSELWLSTVVNPTNDLQVQVSK